MTKMLMDPEVCDTDRRDELFIFSDEVVTQDFRLQRLRQKMRLVQDVNLAVGF